MNTASILIKTDPNVKKEAQKIADDMGISLTSVINRYLKHFIQNKSITFTVSDEQPTMYFNERLKVAEEDIKKGRLVSFKDSDEMLAYLDKEIEDAKKTATSH